MVTALPITALPSSALVQVFGCLHDDPIHAR
jgi:hypothetical protein